MPEVDGDNMPSGGGRREGAIPGSRMDLRLGFKDMPTFMTYLYQSRARPPAARVPIEREGAMNIVSRPELVRSPTLSCLFLPTNSLRMERTVWAERCPRNMLYHCEMGRLATARTRA